MENPDEQRQISKVPAVIITVGLGIAMAYFGVRLGAFGVYAMDEGEVLVGLVALLFGVVLLGIPVAVLVSQVLAMFRRRR